MSEFVWLDYSQDLVNPTEPATIDLAEVNRLDLHQLLEDDAILAMLAGSDFDGMDTAPDRGVAENVVGAGGLFDPPGVEAGEALHVGDGLADVPALVSVHHESTVRADFLANNRGAADVIVDVGAHLDFEV